MSDLIVLNFELRFLGRQLNYFRVFASIWPPLEFIYFRTVFELRARISGNLKKNDLMSTKILLKKTFLKYFPPNLVLKKQIGAAPECAARFFV